MFAVLEKVFFLVCVLPILMAREGLEMLAKRFGKSWLDILLYILLAIFVVALIVFLSLGYTF